VIIVENCEDGEVIINDNDQIIQTNTQSFSQEANNQVGEEEGEEGEEGEGDG
jgi:dUTPase